MMSFHLAEYYFQQKDYTTAVRLYESVSIDNLDNREIADLKFHQGYGYFTQQRLDKAKPLFDAIRQLPNDPNYIDANYYYGFIEFSEKKYAEALQSFKIVEDKNNYGSVVPYYMANIYLLQGQKDKAIDYAESKLSKGGQYYDAELRQLVGHGYYEKKEFAKALPYLEKYVSQSDKVIQQNELYELSELLLPEQRTSRIIEGFKQLGGESIHWRRTLCICWVIPI